jgi:hypothetical protein
LRSRASTRSRSTGRGRRGIAVAQYSLALRLRGSRKRCVKDKTLKVFTAEEGGVEHCQVDNRQVGTDYIADWLGARLLVNG